MSLIMTSEQAARDFENKQRMARSAPNVLAQMNAVQAVMDDIAARYNIDMSRSHGSLMAQMLNKYAKKPLAKINAGEALTNDEQVKIVAAYKAITSGRESKRAFYQGRDEFLDELKQKSMEARPSFLKREVPAKIHTRPEQPKGLERIFSNPGKINQTGAQQAAGNGLGRIFSNPGKINQARPEATTAATAAPLVLAADQRVDGQSTRPVTSDMIPADMGALKKALAEQEAGDRLAAYPALAAALSKSKPANTNDQVDSKRRLGFFSALVRPARVAAAAALAGAALLFGATMLGNGSKDIEPADIALNDSGASIVTAEETEQADVAVLDDNGETVAPVTNSPETGYSFMSAAFDMPTGGYLDQFMARFAAPDADLADEMVSAPIENNAQANDDVELASLGATDELVTDPVYVTIDASAVSPTVGFMTDIDNSAVSDQVAQTVNIDDSAVPDFPPFQTASLDAEAVSDAIPTMNDASEEDAQLEDTQEETITFAASNATTMDGFADGISQIFNDNVPDELQAHLDQIGEGQTVVNDVIHIYETIKNLPDYAKGSAVHAFAVQNLEMIAQGDYGAISTVAQNDLNATEWLPKRFGVMDDQQLASVRPVRAPQA